MKARFLALAALVLGLASCQQEFNDVAQLGGEVDFQLKVDAAELATRAGVAGVDDENHHYDSAFGAIDYLQAGGVDDYRVDWDEVDLRYSLEVYDYNEDGYAGAVPVKDRMVKIVDQYESVVFDLRLVPERNYHFVVFADFVPQGATVESTDGVASFTEHQSTLGKRHIIGDNLGDIRINEDVDAINDEIGDAYFATKKVEVKHQALNVDGIVLQRPYGKLRVIATDLAELNLNVEPKSVFVKYTADRPVHFNAVTGAVETDATVKEYTSVYNDGVCKLIANNTNGLANHFYNAGYDSGSDAYSTVNADGVKRHTHMTLFTDYILAIDQQTTVQFEMTVSDANKEIKKTIFNTEIPVQRNYLTTIVGNVLTSATEITVTINDNFANADNTTDAPYYQVAVENGFEFVNAYYSGLKMFALNDITVRAKDVADYMATRSGAAINPSIDLNGYTLTFVTDSEEPLLEVPADSSFTISDSEGTGAIVAEGAGVAIENKGTLNVEGVALEADVDGTVIENNGETNIIDSTLNNGALKNNEGGEANITGATLEEGSVENNGQANFTDSTLNTGSVENNGQADFTDSTLNTGSVENNGQANVNGGVVDNNAVVNGEGAVVGSQSAEDLQRAIDNAKKGKPNVFTLTGDVVGNITVSQSEGINITIDGNGHKFDGTIFVDGKNRNNGEETLVIKNVKFETSTTAAETKYFIKGLTTGNSYPHNIKITDCSFESTVAKNYNLCGIWFQQFYKLDVINCSAKNLHSLLQAQSCDNYVNVEKATIQACKSGISFGNTANATLKNSVLNTVEYGVRGDGDASRGNLVIEGSKIQAATPVIIRRMKTDGYKVSMNNNTLDKKSGFYHVVFTNGKDDEAYAAPTGNFEYTGFDADWVVFPYTWEVKSKAEFDQALASAATSKITFGSDITDNLTVVQKPDVKITIDGANNKFKGQIKVHSNSNYYANAALTIKNVNFETSTASLNFIEALENGSQRYSQNITVENCTFTATGEAVNTSVAVQVKATRGVTVTGCTATDMHSLIQAQSCDTGDVKVINCTINGKNGVAFKQVKAATVEGTTIVAREYGIRFDGNIDNYGIVAKNNNITAAQPFIVRKMTGKDNTIALEGVNTLASTREAYQIVITNGSDDAEYVKPTGTYTLTGADDLIVYPRNYASTPAELKAAYNDANVKTLYLSSGKHTIELYTNAVPRESLTIIGTEGTQVEFSNLQVRMPLFRNFTIENCEILHMADKKWGMLVFGGGDKADGVYTVKNCTFNGVGTQGIYINEDVSGATYNVLGCTFNGDFGSEGAVTIQNNTDVNFTVNVTGCTFNNVNDNNKIYMIGNYRGWTLNTDLAENEVNWSGSNPNI